MIVMRCPVVQSHCSTVITARYAPVQRLDVIPNAQEVDLVSGV